MTTVEYLILLCLAYGLGCATGLALAPSLNRRRHAIVEVEESERVGIGHE